MIDKVWYDWQLRNPVNANSFFGGSVQALQSLATYNQYPNGDAPFLSVSTCHLRKRHSS
jgi:tyrosinase